MICGEDALKRHNWGQSTAVTFSNPCSATLVFRGVINSVLVSLLRQEGVRLSGVMKSPCCQGSCLRSAAYPVPGQKSWLATALASLFFRCCSHEAHKRLKIKRKTNSVCDYIQSVVVKA